VYYNAFVGGTGGAYQRFELDYWGITSKEVMEYINSHTIGRSNVLAYGPQHILRAYARHAVNVYNLDHDEPTHYDFVTVLYRYGWGDRTCRSAPMVYSIERLGATLAVVRVPPGGAKCR
jgi:hypothetical protein